MTKLELINIDKSGWNLVKFGEVVREPKETCKDIVKEGIEHVVGLEHITAGDIHLRNSATIKESTTFTKKFKIGDMLFGRRRAYLKKAARATFNGICSGDITVFRANKNLIPDLLPFIVNNDRFFDYAVKHSAGGLSPRVKFKDLANYEFLLPPIEEQEGIANLLWSMNEVVERDKESLRKLNLVFVTKIEEEIHGVKSFGKTNRQIIEELSTKTTVVSLNTLGEILKGRGIPKADVIEKGVPCVRYGELYTKHNRIIREFYSFIDDKISTNSFRLKKNDVLFAGSGETIKEIGKSASFISDLEVYAGGDILIFRPNNMDGVYLGYLMNSEFVRQQLNKYGTGSTVMHIYPSDLKKIMVPKIELEEQKEIARKLETVYKTIFDLTVRIDSSKALQKSIINQIFG